MISTLNNITRWLLAKDPRLEGWCNVEKAHALAAAVFSLQPKVCVEIGVWSGRSALPVALSLQEIGQGVLIAIDPFHPESSAEGYDKINADWWRLAADHNYALSQFTNWVAETGTGHIVKHHRACSKDVAPPDVIDLLHIDGQHHQQARDDVARFGSKVRVGGIVFMDDVEWETSGIKHVKLATEDLVGIGFARLYSICSTGSTCEVFQRVK